MLIFLKFDFVFIIIKEKCIENILITGYFGKVFKRVLTKYFSVVKIFIFMF
jgi:hypothetical protein